MTHFFNNKPLRFIRHRAALPAIAMLLAAPMLHAQKSVGQNARQHVGQQDSCYIQVMGGINKSANEHLPWAEFSSYPWSGGAFVAVGKEWSPLWGWRLSLGFDHNVSRNVARCESNDTWGWNDVEAFADVTFDLTDAFHARTDANSHRRFDLKAFLGVGAAYTFSLPTDIPLSYTHPYNRSSATVMAAHTGLTATYRIAHRWRLGAELSHTFTDDRFNGVKTGVPVDARSNLSVGVAYLILPKPKKGPDAPIPYDTRLKQVPALPFVMPDPEETKERTLTGRAFLDFPVNETIIYPEYRNNPNELARIRATIDSALFDKTIVVKSISLHGYASPESPYSNNTRLAKGRTEALKQYISRAYNLKPDIFHTQFTPEDWHNLRSFVAGTDRQRTKDDIWYDNPAILETPVMPDFVLRHRSDILDLIDADLQPDVKEARLKTLADGKPYRWLLDHVFPGLRHTDYIIHYEVRHYTVSECRDLIYTHPEALSLDEMYRLAMACAEGSDEWLDAMLIAAYQYPNSRQANLNAACACVKVRRLTDARRYLERVSPGADASLVQDIIDAMEGKLKRP